MFNLTSGVVYSQDTFLTSASFENNNGTKNDSENSPSTEPDTSSSLSSKIEFCKRFFYDTPLYGPDFSTIYAFIIREVLSPTPVQMNMKREVVETKDGVHVALDWLYGGCCPSSASSDSNKKNSTSLSTSSPKLVVFICPGLNSETDSGYIRSYLHCIKKHNERVGKFEIDALVLNQRGYGGVPLKPGQIPMSGAMTDDVRAVVYKYLNPRELKKRYNNISSTDENSNFPLLVGTGFSMGGNVMTNFLAEEGAKVMIKKNTTSSTIQHQESSSISSPCRSHQNNLIKRFKSIPKESSSASFTNAVASSPTTTSHQFNNNNQENDSDIEEDLRPQILCAISVGTPWNLVGSLRNLATGLSYYMYEYSFLGALAGMMKRNFDDDSGTSASTTSTSTTGGATTEEKNPILDTATIAASVSGEPTATSTTTTTASRVNIMGVMQEINILGYDEHHIAPLHGFRSAAQYYAAAQAFDRIDSVKVPLLAMVALDDPVCGLARLDEEWDRICCPTCTSTSTDEDKENKKNPCVIGENDNIAYMRLPSGGHLGSLSGPLDEFSRKTAPMDRFVVDEILGNILKKM